LIVSITPKSAGWSYVGFEVYRLARGARIERLTEDREVCAVILTGRADVLFGDFEWRDVGSRESVFEGTPDAVYGPPGRPITVTARSEHAEVALCWAPASRGATAALLPGVDIRPLKRGSGRTERTVHNILMEDRPAESLLVTEVLTPAGNWSSYPPHKHDTDDPPRETYWKRLTTTAWHTQRALRYNSCTQVTGRWTRRSMCATVTSCQYRAATIRSRPALVTTFIISTLWPARVDDG